MASETRRLHRLSGAPGAFFASRATHRVPHGAPGAKLIDLNTSHGSESSVTPRSKRPQQKHSTWQISSLRACCRGSEGSVPGLPVILRAAAVSTKGLLASQGVQNVLGLSKQLALWGLSLLRVAVLGHRLISLGIQTSQRVRQGLQLGATVLLLCLRAFTNPCESFSNLRLGRGILTHRLCPQEIL